MRGWQVLHCEVLTFLHNGVSVPLMVAKAFSWNVNATRDAARQGDTFACDVVCSFWEILNSGQ